MRTYSLDFQTSRAEFDETEYIVRRRYNDFIWLRQKLVEAFPTHLIPVSNINPLSPLYTCLHMPW